MCCEYESLIPHILKKAIINLNYDSLAQRRHLQNMTRDSCPFSPPVQELKRHKIKPTGSGLKWNTFSQFYSAKLTPAGCFRSVRESIYEPDRHALSEHFVRTLFHHPAVQKGG